MLLVCQNCGTSYQIAPSSLGATGRSVRCVRCRHVWFASNAAAMSAIAEAHRAEVAEFAQTTSVADFAASPDEAARAAHERISAASPPAADESQAAGTEYGWNVSLSPKPAPAEEPAVSAEPQPEAVEESVPIADAPALAPTEQSEAQPPVDVSPAGEDIETVAARRRARRSARRRLQLPKPGLATAILALIAANMALVGWRADVVRWVPQTASLYAAIGLPVNVRGLDFANVKTVKEAHDGVQVLVVEGTVVSTGSRTAEVPRLRFALRNESGHEIYTWTALPSRNLLAPGDTLAFRSRLASPPREGHDVVVRFFSRRDALAGAQ